MKRLLRSRNAVPPELDCFTYKSDLTIYGHEAMANDKHTRHMRTSVQWHCITHVPHTGSGLEALGRFRRASGQGFHQPKKKNLAYCGFSQFTLVDPVAQL